MWAGEATGPLDIDGKREAEKRKGDPVVLRPSRAFREGERLGRERMKDQCFGI